MSDPIDIKDKCLSIFLNNLDPGKPYHFRWLDHDLYLFVNEDGDADEDIINIYVTDE